MQVLEDNLKKNKERLIIPASNGIVNISTDRKTVKTGK